MKLAMLLHNPKAGDENHEAEDIQHLIKNSGYDCEYYSIKEETWRKAMNRVDLIVVAGGDGSVRTIAKEMVAREAEIKRSPLAILPMGTANNLFKTLEADKKQKDIKEIIKGWNLENRKSLDVGMIETENATDFFIEGVGFGVFPELIDAMRHVERNVECSKESEVKIALHKLIDVVKSYPLKQFELKTKEGDIHEIECFLLEVMNIKSVGPNLYLAPDLSISNGLFNVVYLTEEERQRFIIYLQSLIDDKPFTYTFNTIRTSALTIQTGNTLMHIDDELVQTNNSEIVFTSKPRFLEFLC
ncbi:diacylglycerol kinase family protein [Pseudopedobacter sp.]|uniref:diacylglycerol/lipid kinase family protein n=1 Tax=Pseudopedobacter sp. TaxID=1936787 RepID=UPI00333F7F94